MATHSSTLAWKIPWMEECGRLQSTGSQRVGRDLATSLRPHFSWTRHQVFSALSLFLLVHENLLTTEEMEIQSLENFPGIIQMASGRARVHMQICLMPETVHFRGLARLLEWVAISFSRGFS